MAHFYDLAAHNADGGQTPLATYRGQVLLVVNTASQCAFTPQYAGLQDLQQRYAARGFSVLAFPCNQFGGQEPGDDDDIAQFCATRFGTTFPVFAKTLVNGPGADPIFRHLQEARRGLLGSGRIKWNFTKFLVDRQGEVAARFAPMTKPAAIAAAVERHL